MRLSLLPFSLLALAASILAPVAHASSTTRNPLGALSTLHNATIHTPHHRLTALSNFHLTFYLRDDLLVKFHLEPNHDLLADDTIVTHLAPDGTVTRSEPIDRLGHKVFKGTAWVQRPDWTEWQRVGWARVLVTRDGTGPLFEGAFSVDHDHHHIQSARNYMRTRHSRDPEIELHEGGDEYMVLWRDSDILPDSLVHHQDLKRSAGGDAGTCLSDQLTFNARDDHPVYLAMAKRSEKSYRYGVMDFSHILKRQVDSTTGGNSAVGNLVSTIGQTAGCPTTRKVALVGVATDCTYTADFNSTQTARENVIQQMNTASGIWESTFNISLGLQNLTISDASCPGTPAPATAWNQACSNSVEIQDRLNLFSAWRGTQRDSNSHWTLLSTCNTGSAVGLAWLGQACVEASFSGNNSVTGNGASSNGGETVAGANVVIRTPGASEWQIIAHETGHTFGAVHDCTSDTCADANVVAAQQCCRLSADVCDAGERYIMNPSTTQGVRTFSPCSIGNICSALDRNSVSSQCLTDNRAVTTISGQQCGNGIVEPGEDCDCGGEQGCASDSASARCCDPTTCKFTAGSVCDDANEDCCRNCQFATNGTVCRASTGSCDPQEVCPGNSATCPTDTTTPDGSACGDGLQCASGQCTSRDLQCKSVMGSYIQGNDTYACDSSSCAISCASPEFGRGVCYGLQQNFLDGTVCGGSGRCQNSQCKGASFGGQVRSWIQDHKALVIGLAASIGGLLLLIFLACLISCCRRRRRPSPPPQRRRNAPVPPPPPPGGWQGWNSNPHNSRNVPYPPPMMEQQRGNFYGPQLRSAGPVWASGGLGPGSNARSPAAPRNGNGAWSPPPPPPSYLRQGNSVRYA